MKVFMFLILAVLASEMKENDAENDPKYWEKIEEKNEKNLIVVKIEEDEYVKFNKKSKYIGVTYDKNSSKWKVQRRSKHEKNVYNGRFEDEETAAHASDTLARELMDNGEQSHKLNFPDDYTEVYSEKTKKHRYVGVYYSEKNKRWSATRWSKNEDRAIYNGCYDDEEAAAHASDSLARKLTAKGEQNHSMNFPDDNRKMHAEKISTSKYIGVNYHKKDSKWCARRWSKDRYRMLWNGYYDDEETAAHASDTLARKLLDNGEQKHKLNFPDDYPEESQQKKRKRPKDSEDSQNN